MADSQVKPWEMYKEYTDEQLDKMSFGEIAKIRNQIPDKETEAHNRISKFEHQAYAREEVKANPLIAPAYLTFPPVYAAGKAVGLIGGRSEPSLEQVAHGYRGIVQGVEEAITESKPWLMYKEATSSKKEEDITVSESPMATLFSAIESAKRKAKGLFTDPQAHVEQILGKIIDNPEEFAMQLATLQASTIPTRYFKTPFDPKTGYASVLNNPIHLKDGTRLSGFTDAKQTTFHGYDKNGERITIRRDLIKPEDITWSKDSSKTAEYLKKDME